MQRPTLLATSCWRQPRRQIATKSACSSWTAIVDPHDLTSYWRLPRSLPCRGQGLGAPAGYQAWASEVGEPRSGHWTTRDLLAPCNINQWEFSQRSLSQRQDPAPLNNQQAPVLDTPCQTTSKTGTQPHPLAERLPKIILSSQINKVKTYKTK